MLGHAERADDLASRLPTCRAAIRYGDSKAEGVTLSHRAERIRGRT
jgi:hypothetical protein